MLVTTQGSSSRLKRAIIVIKLWHPLEFCCFWYRKTSKTQLISTKLITQIQINHVWILVIIYVFWRLIFLMISSIKTEWQLQQYLLRVTSKFIGYPISILIWFGFMINSLVYLTIIIAFVISYIIHDYYCM